MQRLLVACLLVVATGSKNNLANRPPPKWYNKARLGLFVHWGTYSVPAFAPDEGSSFGDLLSTQGYEHTLSHNPYAEWYWNTLNAPGSSTGEYHKEAYGDQPYTAFADEFIRQTAQWTPDSLVELATSIQARYLVLTTKHHEGFTLWPSTTPRPSGAAFARPYQSPRDLVSLTAQALRKAGIRFGVYYSGGWDWSIQSTFGTDLATLLHSSIEDDAYIAYVRQHYEELIQLVKPDILWNDLTIPLNFSRVELLERYLSLVPSGAYNDRWNGLPPPYSLKTHPEGEVGGYKTVEYDQFPEGQHRKNKWEFSKPLSNSFGANRNAQASSYVTSDELVETLVDVVSKNGNLLVNVGLIANGSVLPQELAPLTGLSEWLAVNKEAIFHADPWVVSEGEVEGMPDIGVRFMHSEDALYIILMEPPPCLNDIFQTPPPPRDTSKETEADYKQRCGAATGEGDAAPDVPVEVYHPDPDDEANKPCRFTIPSLRWTAESTAEQPVTVELLGHQGFLSAEASGPPFLPHHALTILLPPHLYEPDEHETESPHLQAEHGHGLHWHRYAHVFRVRPKPLWDPDTEDTGAGINVHADTRAKDEL